MFDARNADDDSPATIRMYPEPETSSPVRGETPVLGTLALSQKPPAVTPDPWSIQTLPDTDRAQYAATRTLREFYEDTVSLPGRPARFEPVGRGAARAKETGTKERQAVRRFERFAVLPDGTDPIGTFAGPPLAWLAGRGKYFDRVFERMVASGMSPHTVSSTRSHIKAILNHAAKMNVIDSPPAIKPIKTDSAPVRIFAPDEVDRLLRACHQFSGLFAAVVLNLYAGPRCDDLFGLKKSAFLRDSRGRTMLQYRAQKTGKLQTIPLTPATWYFVSQAMAESPTEYVFEGLHSAETNDTARSRAARRRNALIMSILGQVGLSDVVKPWQTLRRTCNERYESHTPGVGQFILGHSCRGVNATSYRNPTELVRQAVYGLPLDPFLRSLLPTAEQDQQPQLGFEEVLTR